jgi:hypothetical protein
MDSEVLIFQELCFLLHKRNTLNLLRSRARYRKAYYNKAIQITEAHLGMSSTIRRLDAKVKYPAHRDVNLRPLLDRLTKEYSNLAFLRRTTLYPTKWINMGLHKLRSLVLENEYKYAKAKFDTMKFTIKYRTRIRNLLKTSKQKLKYDNGFVSLQHKESKSLSREDIANLSQEYLANKAIHKMLKE